MKNGLEKALLVFTDVSDQLCGMIQSEMSTSRAQDASILAKHKKRVADFKALLEEADAEYC